MAADVRGTVLHAWAAWIQQRSGESPDRALEAANVALAALDRGASQNAAALLAVTAARGRAFDLAPEVVAERARLQMAQAELDTIAPSAELTPAALSRLKSILSDRLREATLALDTFEAGTRVRPKAGRVVAVPGAQPVRPAVPRKPLRLVFQEFLRDQSILIVAYTGAFLLIVATVLFELYGVTGKEGWIRFGAVLVLDFVFAIAGWVTWRSKRLRIVGEAYVAIAALMAPLAFAAAYIFLDLQRTMSINAAVAISGVSCAILYGALGFRLRSSGYAVLAMVAFPVGWAGLLNQLELGIWWGAGFAPLALAYFAGSFALRRSLSQKARLPLFADGLGHVAAAIGVGAAVNFTTTPNDLARGLTPVFLILTVAYAVRFALGPAPLGAMLAMTAFGATWVSGVAALELGPWAGPALLPLVAIFALPAVRLWRIPHRELLERSHAILLHVSTAIAVGMALASNAAWPLVITFAGVAAVYGTRRALGVGSQASAGIAVGGVSSAWIAAVASWAPSQWTPVAAATLAIPLVAVTLLSRPAWIVPFSKPALLQGYAAAILAAALTALWYAGCGPSWPLVIALVTLAATFGVEAWRNRATVAAWFATAAFAGAWAAAIAPAGVPEEWRAATMAPVATLLVLATFVGARRGGLAVFARPVGMFTHVTAAGALLWSPHVLSASGELRPEWAYTAALGILTFAYALSAVLERSLTKSWMPAIGVTVTSIAAMASAGFQTTGFAVALTLLAWAYVVMWKLASKKPVRNFFLVGAAVQAFSVASMDVQHDWLKAGLIVGSTAALVVVARWSRDFRIGFLPALLAADAWFWCVKAIVPPPPQPSASDLVRAYLALPIAYGAMGLGLRWRSGVRWASPAYVVGAAGALAVPIGGVLTGDIHLAGWALLAYAAVTYTIGAVERWWWLAIAAAVAALTGTGFLLYAAGAAAAWYPIAGSAAALALYGGHFIWARLGPRGKYWSEVHSHGALIVAGLTTLACFAVVDFWRPGADGTIAAAVAALTLTAVAVAFSRQQGVPVVEYCGIFATSLAAFWILRRFNVTVPHWLVLPSSVVAIALGLRLEGDQRIAIARAVPRAVTIAGVVAMLGSALLETTASPDQAWLYTVVLIVESVVGLLAGIGLRSRLVVIAFAAGIAVGAIRTLFLVIQALPLWLVIGILAVVLLAGAAALALLRERLSRTLHRLA